MKHLLCSLALALALLAPSAEAASRKQVGIAATVNADVVTMSDVSSRMQLYLSGAPSAPPPEARRQMEAQILDKLIDEKLQMQEAETLGITVDQAQLDDAFAHVARQNGLAADEFRNRLRASGVRVETLYDQIRAELAWAQVVRRRLRPQINVSEDEIDSAMDQMQRDRQKPQYHLAEIFLPVPAEPQDGQVRENAEAIARRIAGGASFSSAARQYSQAPGAALGGDLGWVRQGQLDPALDAAIQKMKPGQISPPVRTEKGYHILFLRDLRHPGTAGAGAARAAGPVVHLRQIVIPVAPTDPEPVVSAKIARARALKAEIDSCAKMDERAKDFPSPGTGDMGRGPLNALPPPVKRAVEGLETGVLSDPLQTEAGVSVFMVCAREGGAGAADAFTPPKADEAAREDVANRIGMKRLDQMQERYLRDLRATAFIEKRI